MMITDTKKHFGIVYTPKSIVDIMLAEIPDLGGIKICDPACGDGRFLVSIAERICRKINEGHPQDSLRETLNNLTGFDVDEKILKVCQKQLDKVVRNYNLKPEKWNLHQVDAIDTSAWKKWEGHFDCVIGNPPYVRVQHLEDSRRKKIKNGDWSFMSGSTDLFLLFFDMGIRLIDKNGGRLVFITPNTWMKSQAGRLFRDFLKNQYDFLTAQNRVQNIYDFGEHQVFENATTYTAITVIDKNTPIAPVIPVKKCDGIKNGIPTLKGGYSIHIQDDSWIALTEQEREFMEKAKNSRYKLSDVATINVGIQTLADKIFIASDEEMDVESGILRRIYKASVMKNGKDRIDRSIIYPYKNGKLIPEEELADCFPRAYNRLLDHKEHLLKRDKGGINPDRWYGFGREVSIVSGFGKKILTAAMNKEPNFQYCNDSDSLYYSGYCVKPKSGVSVNILMRELNSKKMERFIKMTSRPYQSGWYSYAKSFIQSFPVTEEVYDAA